MESDRFKAHAGLLRNATSILWNIQVKKEDRKYAEELWPFPWENRVEQLTPEEAAKQKRRREAQRNWTHKNI